MSDIATEIVNRLIGMCVLEEDIDMGTALDYVYGLPEEDQNRLMQLVIKDR